jgi:hypothetical protein
MQLRNADRILQGELGKWPFKDQARDRRMRLR